jgi:hypothetical protein
MTAQAKQWPLLRALTISLLRASTVRNRLRRVESLTGRTFTNPREAAEIYLALSTVWQRQEGAVGDRDDLG